MSTKKRIRKNRYKKQTPGKKLKNRRIAINIGLYLKIIAGICFLGAMSVSLIFIHDLLIQCDYFSAREIQVSGNVRLTHQDVIQTAGIETGENILSWNLHLIRRRLKAHPLISDADIMRELPTGLTIHITEHQALAVLDFGRYFLINTKGDIFKERDASDPETLPIIKGLDYSDLDADGMPQSKPLKAVMDVLVLKEKIDRNIPQLSVKNILVDREIGVTLQTSGNIESILLGYGDYRIKYDKLKTICSFLNKRGQLRDVDSLNLVNPDRIILKRSMILSSAKKQKEVLRAGT